jgi:hypothetical protein
LFVFILCFVAGFVLTGIASAAFVAGNLVIYRVGAGQQEALADDGNEVFIDEYTTAGALVQSIAMPSTGGGVKLIADGTEVSEGFLTLSPDGSRLVLTGYNSTINAGAPLSSFSGAAVNRSVAIVDTAENISLYGFSDAGATPRSAVVDGPNLYITGSSGGVRYQDASTLVAGTTGNTSTQLNAAPTDLRQVNIFAGQLYVSTTAGALGAVGTGEPTTAGQSVTNLPGVPTNSSPFAFFFADLDSEVFGVDTLYIASDNADALTKYSLVGGTWTDNGTVGTGGQDYRGLTGTVSGSTVTLYAIRGGHQLVSLVDASGYNGAFAGAPSLLASSPVNTAFRGVAFAPVPEASAVLFGAVVCGGFGLAALCRRRIFQTAPSGRP